MNEKELALVHYAIIIEYRKKNLLPETEYGEKHHILPKSCGGLDEASNIVRMLPEEHFLCHCFLPFIFDEGEAHKKMVFAWNTMHNVNGKEIDLFDYGELRREHQRYVSEMFTGRENYFKGKHLSEETKRKLSEKLSGKNSPWYGRHHTEEQKRKISQGNLGKKCPESAKRKLSEINTGKKASEETKRKISEAGYKRWKTYKFSDEAKARMSEARKAYWADKANRERMSAAKNAYWADRRKKEVV
jgi:hypothetical protein